MSAYDDYVIINSLTATIRNHENTIAELEYNLKSCEERIAKLSIDKNKRIKELENELVKEEPTDRFAMGTPGVGHADENKEDK